MSGHIEKDQGGRLIIDQVTTRKGKRIFLLFVVMSFVTIERIQEFLAEVQIDAVIEIEFIELSESFCQRWRGVVGARCTKDGVLCRRVNYKYQWNSVEQRWEHIRFAGSTWGEYRTTLPFPSIHRNAFEVRSLSLSEHPSINDEIRDEPMVGNRKRARQVSGERTRVEQQAPQTQLHEEGEQRDLMQGGESRAERVLVPQTQVHHEQLLFVDDDPRPKDPVQQREDKAEQRWSSVRECINELAWQGVKQGTRQRYEACWRAIKQRQMYLGSTEEDAFRDLLYNDLDDKLSGETLRIYLSAARKVHLANEVADPWSNKPVYDAITQGLRRRGGQKDDYVTKVRYPYDESMVNAIVAKANARRRGDIAAGIRLLWTSGMRSSHVANIVLRDLEHTPNGWKLRIDHLKCERDPLKSIMVDVEDTVARYLQTRTKSVADLGLPNWSTKEALAIIKEVSVEQQWDPRYVYDLHCLRHAFALRLTQEGKTDDEIQKAGNWHSVGMARRYAAAAGDRPLVGRRVGQGERSAVEGTRLTNLALGSSQVPSGSEAALPSHVLQQQADERHMEVRGRGTSDCRGVIARVSDAVSTESNAGYRRLSTQAAVARDGLEALSLRGMFPVMTSCRWRMSSWTSMDAAAVESIPPRELVNKTTRVWNPVIPIGRTSVSSFSKATPREIRANSSNTCGDDSIECNSAERSSGMSLPL